MPRLRFGLTIPPRIAVPNVLRVAHQRPQRDQSIPVIPETVRSSKDTERVDNHKEWPITTSSLIPPIINHLISESWEILSGDMEEEGRFEVAVTHHMSSGPLVMRA